MLANWTLSINHSVSRSLLKLIKLYQFLKITLQTPRWVRAPPSVWPISHHWRVVSRRMCVLNIITMYCMKEAQISNYYVVNATDEPNKLLSVTNLILTVISTQEGCDCGTQWWALLMHLIVAIQHNNCTSQPHEMTEKQRE